MNTLQDPRLKKTTFLMAITGQVIAVGLIFLAFTHGIGWLIVILQVWIALTFFLGILPMKIENRHIHNRLRWEQMWAYPAINIFFYSVMSGDIITAIAYLIGVAGLSIKYSSAIEKIDNEYSLKILKDNALKNTENIGNYWHT